MTLEDTLKGVYELGNYTGGLRNEIESVKSGKGRTDNKGIDSLVLKYTDGEVTPEQAELYQKMSSEARRPFVDKYMPGAYKKVKGELVEKVKPVYKEIISTLGNEELYALLNLDYETAFTDKDEYSEAKNAKKELNKWKEVLEKKDIETYMKSIENPIIKEILEEYSKDEDIMLSLIASRANFYQTEFLEYFVGKEKLEKLAKKNKGKIDEKALPGLIDIEKARGYILSSIENSKKVDDELYEVMGIVYSQYVQNKEIEKRDKSSKDSVEKAEKELDKAA